MSATPPSIAIAAPVLGGPEVVRVVLNSSKGECAVAAGRLLRLSMCALPLIVMQECPA